MKEIKMSYDEFMELENDARVWREVQNGQRKHNGIVMLTSAAYREKYGNNIEYPMVQAFSDEDEIVNRIKEVTEGPFQEAVELIRGKYNEKGRRLIEEYKRKEEVLEKKWYREPADVAPKDEDRFQQLSSKYDILFVIAGIMTIAFITCLYLLLS